MIIGKRQHSSALVAILVFAGQFTPARAQVAVSVPITITGAEDFGYLHPDLFSSYEPILVSGDPNISTSLTFEPSVVLAGNFCDMQSTGMATLHVGGQNPGGNANWVTFERDPNNPGSASMNLLITVYMNPTLTVLGEAFGGLGNNAAFNEYYAFDLNLDASHPFFFGANPPPEVPAHGSLVNSSPFLFSTAHGDFPGAPKGWSFGFTFNVVAFVYADPSAQFIVTDHGNLFSVGDKLPIWLDGSCEPSLGGIQEYWDLRGRVVIRMTQFDVQLDLGGFYTEFGGVDEGEVLCQWGFEDEVISSASAVQFPLPHFTVASMVNGPGGYLGLGSGDYNSDGTICAGKVAEFDAFPASANYAVKNWYLNGLLAQRGGNIFLLPVTEDSVITVDFDYHANPLELAFTSSAPQNIFQTVGVLQGRVNPRGPGGGAWFRWGLTVAYGNTTSVIPLGSGSNDFPVSAQLTNLTPNTTYYYQIVATNSDGITYGTNDSFTTLASSPNILSLAVIETNATNATLTGTVDPYGLLTQAWFVVGPTASNYSAGAYPILVGMQNTNVIETALVTNLAPGTTYHYTLVASNSAGVTYAADAAFRTLSTPPSVTTGLAVDVNGSTAFLTGMVNPNGLPTTAHFIYMDAAGTNMTAPRLVGDLETNFSFSELVTNLAPRTAYSFVLMASNASGVITGRTNFFSASDPILPIMEDPLFAASQALYQGDRRAAVAVVAADVNRDGKLDLISANQELNTITVRTNDGHGGFPIAAELSVGQFFSVVTALVAADVNGDGAPDLVCADANTDALYVFLNDGHGHFPAQGQSLPVESGPTSLIAADFNGDGFVDLACANRFGQSVTVLLNNGSGQFQTSGSNSIPLGVSPVSLTAVDVNGDGFVDLVTVNGNDTVSVLLNDGSGNFSLSAQTQIANGAPVGVACVTAANLGGGGVNLVCADAGENTLRVLTPDGAGGFRTASILRVGQAPVSVAVADVNADGLADLICANSGDNTLTVLTNDGLGGFWLAATLSVATNPVAVIAADLNQIHITDLVSANYGDDSLTVVWGRLAYNPLGPTAHDLTGYRAAGTAWQILVSEVAGDPYQAPNVRVGPGNQGAALSTDNVFIYYTPTNDNNDTFTYTVDDGHGRTANGTITLDVLSSPGGVGKNVTTAGGAVTINFGGIPGRAYDIQRSTDLRTWTTVTPAPILAPDSGAFSYSDYQPANAAYYRLISN